MSALEIVKRKRFTEGSGAYSPCDNGCRSKNSFEPRWSTPPYKTAQFNLFIAGYPAGALCDNCKKEAEAIWALAAQPNGAEPKDVANSKVGISA